MARKADIKNLIKEAERKDLRVIVIEKMLEAAKSDSAGAWDKVSVRKNELEQEKNNGLAAVDREFFWDDITPEKLRMKWGELLLINEVREYIESERAKHIADTKNNAANDNNSSQDNSEQAEDTALNNMDKNSE